MKIAPIEISPSKVTAVPADHYLGQNKSFAKILKTPQAQVDSSSVREEVSAPPAEHITISKLEGANDQIQSIATQIRAVDKTMGLIDENVKNMQASIEGVLKVYPPYPIDSAERIEVLRQFAGLRQQIDQLTVPAPDDSPAKILGNPKTFPEVGDWKVPTGNGKPDLTISRQPVHSGTDGLDLPELAPQASDKSLHKALAAIIEARQTLQSRRKGFVADANQVMAAMR